MIYKLIELYNSLRLVNTSLLITDEITGAGYIITANDVVVVRWGTYNEGIRVLTAYKDAV